MLSQVLAALPESERGKAAVQVDSPIRLTQGVESTWLVNRLKVTSPFTKFWFSDDCQPAPLQRGGVAAQMAQLAAMQQAQATAGAGGLQAEVGLTG